MNSIKEFNKAFSYMKGYPGEYKKKQDYFASVYSYRNYPRAFDTYDDGCNFKYCSL